MHHCRLQCRMMMSCYCSHCSMIMSQYQGYSQTWNEGGPLYSAIFPAILASVFSASLTTMLAISVMYHTGWGLTCEWMHVMCPQPRSFHRMCVMRVLLDPCAHQKNCGTVGSILLSNLKGGGGGGGAAQRYVALARTPSMVHCTVAWSVWIMHKFLR